MKTIFLIFFTVLFFPAFAISQASGEMSKAHDTRAVASDKEEIIQPLRLVTPLLDGSPTFRYHIEEVESSGFLGTLGHRPGLAFAASAVLPGLGQAANKNWVKTGIFLAIEATAIYAAVEYQNRGKRGERSYEQWADQNWSVVQYANWLVEYHDVHGINNPYIEQLRAQLNGATPAFNPDIDWQTVSLALLRNTERNTPYIVTDDLTANNFSHVLPDYGSQQYYELIAKYYQYQAGWRDYHDYHNSLGHTGDQFNQRFFIERNGEYASPLFWEGADRALQFNNDYRTGGTFRLLLIANHVFSAFDAYFTVKLKQNRLTATPSLLPGHQLSMMLRF
jgi:hypothetical protein